MPTGARALLGIGMALAFIGGCRDPGGDVNASWLRADVRGVHDVSYFGSGDFTVGRAHDVPIQFTLNSLGLDASAGHRLILHRRGEGQPTDGAYVLGPLELRGGVRVGFTAYYFRKDGGLFEAFAASSGTLHVTTSTDELVEGTFEFTGVLYCSSPTMDDFSKEYTCTGPDALDPAAPKLAIVGSFVAVPFRVGRVVVD